MSILGLFGNKTESGEKELGKFECNADQLPTFFVQLMDKMGLTNPRSVSSSASKAVNITKNEDGTYTVALLFIEPPLYITWTTPFTASELLKAIDTVISQGKKVGYLNTQKLSSGAEFFQLGVA